MSTTFDVQLFWVAFWCYLLGWFAFAVWLGLRKPILTKLGTALYALGFVPQTIAFGVRWANSGHFPMSNMYEYLAVMSWMAVASFVFLTWRYRHWLISALISPGRGDADGGGFAAAQRAFDAAHAGAAKLLADDPRQSGVHRRRARSPWPRRCR